MLYDGVLKFKGTWRTYQARVLKNAYKYMADGHVHIVAAPGSGKTTLGIELMRQMGQPALVLAPSVTIREQWVARITEAFLCDGIKPEDYLSQSLKEPKAITVATYQALHSAMRRLTEQDAEDAGSAEVQEEEVGQKQKTEDFSGFDLKAAMKKAGIGVLCLDECHHLRSEWWKALEEFKTEFDSLKVIALTATPPYDSTPAMWKRYMDMCGEIDEEITIPELVKEGSLCPHQDYVYFNYPTEEEQAEVVRFKERSRSTYQKLMNDEEFAKNIATHGSLSGTVSDDVLLENPPALASLLVFLQAKGMTFPSRLQRLLGADKLPEMDAAWMEKLLQAFLYEDTESYSCSKEYREQLTEELKKDGLIEKKKVVLTASEKVEKMLLLSKAKCNSIRDIVLAEYSDMGTKLRLLVLTDYIRKEYEKAVGVETEDVTALGVLPFFEMLRRAAGTAMVPLRLGILCGTVVVIPAEAREALDAAIEGIGKVEYTNFGSLADTDYLKVNAVGDAHFLTGAVTQIFTKGYMQVLIGTKSLLGEGWDSPCINSLILASFVGSFMLSNQMRGRAIRVFKEQPEKSSNIWHLVCLHPWEEGASAQEQTLEPSEDYALLKRRMEHFMGLHYTENTIESGIDRLAIIKPPFDTKSVENINAQMLSFARQRDTLKERWNSALAIHKKMDVVEETEVETACVPEAKFRKSFSKTAVAGAAAAGLLLCGGIGLIPGLLAKGAAVLALAGVAKNLPKTLQLSTPERRLKSIGKGIRKAMMQKNLFESTKHAVEGEQTSTAAAVWLSGGSGRDKTLFAECVKEFFSPIDNQRYLLVKTKGKRGADGFYAVPQCFAARKEDAQAFAECMEPYMDDYELVYTRNEAGRGVLLEGRIKALSNIEDRARTNKKIKGALE